jgi:hypothetical protein
MPSSVSSLLAAAALRHGGAARWDEDVDLDEPGVYLISIDDDPDFVGPAATAAPISAVAIAELLEVRSELKVDGRRPTPVELEQRIASFWLVDEPVVYIGLAGTSVRNRVKQYYRTPLGARRPHAGGWFLKALASLPDLWVHYAEASEPKASEDQMLERFVAGISPAARRRLRDPDHPFPFANLEWPQGTRKLHGITGAKEPRR